jgi:hypothetical protein
MTDPFRGRKATDQCNDVVRCRSSRLRDDDDAIEPGTER